LSFNFSIGYEKPQGLASRADGEAIDLLKSTFPHVVSTAREGGRIARVRRTLSAAVLSALLASCWNGGSQGLLLCCDFRKEECCSMRVHIDRKRLDGDAIAFVVITLLIVIAFAY
jgi:hypothetical protein